MEGKEKVRNAKLALDKIVGMNIRKERELRKMTKEELAEILDLKPYHISMIERGVRGATPTTLTKLTKAFNIPVDNFFTEHDETKPAHKKCKCEQSASRKKISALLSQFNEEELDLLIPLIRWILTMRKVNYKPTLT